MAPNTVATRRTLIYFSAKYLPSMGGVEFFTDNLCKELLSRGYEIYIVCIGTADTFSPIADSQSHSENHLNIVRLHGWGWKRAPFIYWDSHTKACINKIKSLHPDYIMINTRLYGLSRYAVKLANSLGMRPVLLDHGTSHVALSNSLLSYLSAKAEHVVTQRLKMFDIDYYGISEQSSNWLKHFGIKSCGEINNAIDAQRFIAMRSERNYRSEFAIDDNVLLVIFAGRLLEIKGIDIFLNAARKLSHNKKLHFFVAGTGELQQKVVQMQHALPNLNYLGRLNHSDLAALLTDGDIFCLPSVSEGMPTSLLEAAVCSTALITTKVGGVKEIIPDASHGIILPDRSVKSLVQAISTLEKDRKLLSQLKQNEEQFVKKEINWSHTANQAIAALEYSKRKNKK